MRIQELIQLYMIWGDSTDGDGNATLIYSLSGVDASYFEINENTGEVTLLASPDFETQPIYNFNVIVSDGIFADTEIRCIKC